MIVPCRREDGDEYFIIFTRQLIRVLGEVFGKEVSLAENYDLAR
jgi:hypothetical protein